MQVPLEVSYHQIDPPAWAEEDIRQRVEKLDRIYGRLTAVRVRVQQAPQHRNTGTLPSVHIELSVPQKKLVVTREPHQAERRYAAPDLRTIVREAFDAAERQLKQFKDEIRGDVKPHDVQFYGQVSQLYPNEDHGFLLTKEGSQLYFHRNSVLSNEFDRLQVGSKVHYVEEVGDTGPVASKVRLFEPE